MTINLLSLGAGVQSSTLALMAAAGDVGPMPNAAIFADTGAEPDTVYHWLDWLEKQLPFPVHRVSNGNLTDESLIVRTGKKSGEKYMGRAVPAYVLNADGSKGGYFRQCTDYHKLVPLKREVDRLRNGEPATVWIGISWDEVQRMKQSTRKNIEHRWPLIDLRMTRGHCLEWMQAHGYPTPPRSACVYCPYHSDKEWVRLRDTDPASWQKAIYYEKRLQAAVSEVPRLTGTPYLHPQRVPLEQVVFSDTSNQMSLWNTMQSECTGMCGV